MEDPTRTTPAKHDELFDRRTLVKAAAVGVAAGGLLGAGLAPTGADASDSIPNNFHAAIHVSTTEAMPYAYAALETISEHYKKAQGRLILDGSAVTLLSDDGAVASLKSASDAGAEIVAARDACQINNIDPDSLPDFIDAGSNGIVVVIDSYMKHFHYCKL